MEAGALTPRGTTGTIVLKISPVTVILSRAKDPSVGRYARFSLGSFARLRMTAGRAVAGFIIVLHAIRLPDCFPVSR